MGPYDYIVESLNGDYAYLKRIDIADLNEPFMIAIALLPEDIDIGTKIHWENLEYFII